MSQSTPQADPRHFQGWTYRGQCQAAVISPSPWRAGDSFDSGYRVQTFAANGYWRGPIGTFATLAEAIAFCRQHDAGVMAGRVPNSEQSWHPGAGPYHEQYRIGRAVRNYLDSHSMDVYREAWGWCHPGTTVQLGGTVGDPVELPADRHADLL